MTTTPIGELLDVIRQFERSSERGLQVELGPSDIGQPCERRLVLQLLGAADINPDREQWPATVGTAIHAMLAEAFGVDNARRRAAGEPERWLIEQEITIRPGVLGHTDLVDLQNWTVIDHKTTSVTKIRSYRRSGRPPEQYRAQAHLYGLGWARAGLPIRTVQLVFYPRSGILTDSWAWSEPYDPNVAVNALDRMDGLLIGANAAEGMGGLDQYVAGLSRDTGHCDWCPYHTAQDRPAADPVAGCAGPAEDPQHAAEEPRDLFA